MKKVFTIIAFICLTAVNTACSEDDDYPSTAIYEGVWSGSFSGDDTGTWSATINEEGAVTGYLISSQFPGVQIPLEGNIDAAGSVGAIYGNDFISGEFVGELSEDSGTGTWSNDEGDFSGTWEGNRE